MYQERPTSTKWAIAGAAILIVLGVFPCLGPPVYFISFLFTVFLYVIRTSGPVFAAGSLAVLRRRIERSGSVLFL